MSQFGRTIDFRGRGPLARLPHAESSSAVVRAEEAGKNCFSVVLTLKIGLCSQSWPNQVRQQFLALYLVRRTTFWVSSSQKILFSHSKDTSGGSAILKFVSGSVSPIQISCIGSSLVTHNCGSNIIGKQNSTHVCLFVIHHSIRVKEIVGECM